MRKKLYIGCTAARHKQIGINAIINARGGFQHLNEPNLQEIEAMRDAQKILDRINSRIRFYQFNSRVFRKNAHRFQHLISERTAQ